MSRSQSNASFTTPPRWLIPWITKANVWIYERSDGKYGAAGAGMRQILLRAQRRRSGKTQTVCLPYWLDPDGNRIVVASFSGAPRNPAWYHNVTDTSVNPKVWVKDRQDEFWATAHSLDGEDYRATWDALTADRPFYNDYQNNTERRIPLVRLVAVDR